MTARRKAIRIGLSARIFHPEPGGTGIRSKTLQVLEQSVAQWLAARDVMVLMIPSVVQDGELMRSNIRLRDYAEYLDGLVLQGGADVSPRAYGEEPLQPEWSGDPVRDAYELELFHEFLEARRPVLGICRGMQLINVALGGSLWQDLPSQCPGAVAHESADYDRNRHAVTFAEASQLARWYGDVTRGEVISIHHQAEPAGTRCRRRGMRRRRYRRSHPLAGAQFRLRRAVASGIPSAFGAGAAGLRADPRRFSRRGARLSRARPACRHG